MFLAVAANALFIPFSFDTLVLATAQPFDGPSRRRTSSLRLLYTAGAVFGWTLVVGCWLLLHFCITAGAMFPVIMTTVFACGACWRFLNGFCNRCAEMRLTSILFAFYAVLLVLAWFLPASLLDEPANRSLAAIAVFAVPSFFSDDVARWIQRREP
jgi:hypothetical protein